MTPKGKNVPCEGCRERKKKCSSGQPCDRCKRLGIDCYYLKPAAPPDLEYVDIVNSCELEANVGELERIMTNLEREVLQLRRSVGYDQAFATHTRSSSMDSITLSSSSSCSSMDFPSSDSSGSNTPRLSVVKVTKPAERMHNANWRLTLGEYGLRIETDIRSYDDLLHQVRSFGLSIEIPPLHKQPSFELPSIPRYAVSTAVRHAHFRAIHHCAENNNTLSPPKLVNNHTLHPTKDLPFKLLDIYFSCQFLRSVVLHRPTFYSLFVENNKDPNDSPVICALCADILTMRCRHVQLIVPFSQQVGLHTYYYNRARSLIAPCFDDVTLESFLTYLFLARYFTNLTHPAKAQQYLEIALRIRHLLANEFAGSSPDPTKAGVIELFNRSHAILGYVAQKIEFFNNQRGVPMRSMAVARQKSRSMTKQVREAINLIRSQVTPMPDESTKETRSLMRDVYSNAIRFLVHPFLNHSRSPDKVSIPLELLARTEQSLNRYVLKEIPAEYRLKLDIFENDLSDDEFRERVNNDPNMDACSVTLMIHYYQALLSLNEPFLPTLPDEYRKPRQTIFTLGSTEEVRYTTPPPSPAEEAYKRDQFMMRALEVCYRSAVIIVRLLEYLVLDQHLCCDVLIPCFLSAWDMHVRNACLGFADPEKAQKHVPVRIVKTSRDYVMRCIHLLRKGYHYNPADRAMWVHHHEMENELLQAMFSTRPYTAEYWNPWSSTAAW